MRADVVILLAMSSAMTAHTTPPSPLSAGRLGSYGGNERMIGGRDAADGAAPYQVYMVDSSGRDCGGSILNERWILTAAHCIDGPARSIAIRVGSDQSSRGGRVYTSEDAVVHEDWDKEKLCNDIGLVRTSEEIEFDDRVRPIELVTEDTPAGVDVTVTGFGDTIPPHIELPPERYQSRRSMTLQTLKLRTIETESCKEIWANLYRKDITSGMLCAFVKKGQGMCYGDSGGPLVYEGRLAGIVSFVWPCAQGIPDVFTRVYSYIDWIESYTMWSL